jgi:benzoyl-CoA-dihydrodiol lyase
MLDDPERPNTIALSVMNRGAYPMSNGLSRLEVRFLGDPETLAALAEDGGFEARAAFDRGLVSFAPDDLDWADEVRMAGGGARGPLA